MKQLSQENVQRKGKWNATYCIYLYIGEMVWRLVSPTNFDRLYPGTGNRWCLSRFRPCCCSKCVCLKFWVQRKCWAPGHAPTGSHRQDMARHGKTWRDVHLLRCFQPGETSDVWHLSTRPWGLSSSKSHTVGQQCFEDHQGPVKHSFQKHSKTGR